MIHSTMRSVLLLAIAVLSALLSENVARGENWPQWRGPAGTSVSGEKGLPIIWHEERGIAWKCELPQWGTSTPAIWEQAIFLTSHTNDGRLLLLKIDKKSGQIVWTQQVGAGEAARKPTAEAWKRSKQKFHDLHNLASPSPVTDGKTVVVHFGNGDLAAYDFDGKQHWRRNLQDDYGSYSIWWGHANSPVLHDGAAISVCMQDSLADIADKPVESYLVAHDLKTGDLRWKSSRLTGAPSEQGDAYTTPILARLNGMTQLIVMGGNQLDAYDPATGKQIWFLPGLVGGRTVTGPTVAGEMVFATRGQKGALIAVKPKANAKELSSRDVAWEYTEGTPDTCCPVVWNELLFTVTDDGIARCIDAASGNIKWKERLKGGKYKASPVAADGRIYFLSTDGLCTVVSAASRFSKLVENQLDDETIASPAISDGRIYIRGKKSLYSISR